jgi:hypothetical protein
MQHGHDNAEHITRAHIRNNGIVVLCTTMLFGIDLILVPQVFSQSAIGNKALFASAGLLPVALAYKLVRSGFVVGPTGVLVRGLIRSRTISWHEIQGFGFASNSALNSRGVYIAVMLVNGRKAVTAVVSSSSRQSTFATATMSFLEHAQESQRSHPGTSGR